MIALIFIFLLLALFLYLHTRPTYIHKSSIDGEGLFANKEFNQGDIILDNIFPHKPKERILYDPISQEEFAKYISIEGSKINHCKQMENSYVETDNYSEYKLYAKYDIKPGEEILVNYDDVHSMYPFISGSHKNYTEC